MKRKIFVGLMVLTLTSSVITAAIPNNCEASQKGPILKLRGIIIDVGGQDVQVGGISYTVRVTEIVEGEHPWILGKEVGVGIGFPSGCLGSYDFFDVGDKVEVYGESWGTRSGDTIYQYMDICSSPAYYIRKIEDAGAPPSIPLLISPVNNATLPNQPINWRFDWSIDDEGSVKGYQIYVIGPQAKVPIVDTFVTASHYTYISEGYVADHNLNGWTWKVKAQDNAGNWSEWSTSWTFNVKHTRINWAPTWKSELVIHYEESEVRIEQRFKWSQEALDNLKRKLDLGFLVAFQWDLKRFIPGTGEPADVWDYWIDRGGLCQGIYFETNLPDPITDYWTEEADLPFSCLSILRHPDDEEFEVTCYNVDSLEANKEYYIVFVLRKKKIIQFDKIDIETKFERIEYGPHHKAECSNIIDCIDCLASLGSCGLDKLKKCIEFGNCVVTYTHTDPDRIEGVSATGEPQGPDESSGGCVGSILLILMLTVNISVVHIKRD